MLTWWQITWGIFCSPFSIVCFFACKTSSSRIPCTRDTKGKMLISHVGEWWHVRQAEDFWHMVHIWGSCHKYLDHTACSYRETPTAVYGVEQTNPLHYALQVMHATGLVCSNSAVYIALSECMCQSLLSICSDRNNGHVLVYVNRNHFANFLRASLENAKYFKQNINSCDFVI